MKDAFREEAEGTGMLAHDRELRKAQGLGGQWEIGSDRDNNNSHYVGRL